MPNCGIKNNIKMYKPQITNPATPFYYYDIALLRQTLQECCSAASRHGYHVHYAMKANVEPRILKEINAVGLGADCVSGWEVKAAIENGFPAGKIVFAGVGKSDAEIKYALEHNIFAFNCESLQELEVINQIASEMGKVATIALRINPNIEPKTHKYIATGQSESKFGISYTEIDKAIEQLAVMQNLTIVGLHFHIGSQILDLKSFRELAQKAGAISDWFAERGINIEHLNMGGGLGVDYYEPEANPIADFEAYFQTFADNLQLRAGQQVHFELGRALVAQCGELITKVLYTKETAAGSHFAIVDAGMTELIRPSLYGAYHKIVNISAEGTTRTMKTYYIGGPICESSDIFARDIYFPYTMRGDMLSIRSAGAYGSIMSSHYNMRPTAPSYYSIE